MEKFVLRTMVIALVGLAGGFFLSGTFPLAGGLLLLAGITFGTVGVAGFIWDSIRYLIGWK